MSKPPSIYEAIQLEAIEAKLNPTLLSFERKVRRWYSKTFHTPLKDVYNIPWPTLLLNYYEEEIEGMEFNDVFDMVKRDHLPDFVDSAEEEDQAFADSLVKEQEKTMKKSQSLNSKGDLKAKPKSMNLSFGDESLEEDPTGEDL